MANVDYDSATRKFSGTATYHEGILSGGTFGDGEIDFTEQGGTSLLVDLSTTADGGGNFPLEGQAFSEQIGWVFADHGGTDPAAMTPSGNLTGNFWNNVIGWIMCSGADVGAGNDHVWDPGASAGSAPGGVSSSLTLWLDADDGSTVYQDKACTAASTAGASAVTTGDVGCWQDKSGQNNHVTVATDELDTKGYASKIEILRGTGA